MYRVIIFRIILLLVVMIGAAVVSVHIFLNSQTFISTIEDVLSDTLESFVQIDGPIRLHLIPSLAATINHVRVGESDADSFKVDSVYFDFKLKGLFEDKLTFENITINQPRLVMSSNGQDSGPATRKNEKRKFSPFHSVVIKSVLLQNGSFQYSIDDSIIEFPDIDLNASSIELVKDHSKLIPDLSSLYTSVNFTADISSGKIHIKYPEPERIKNQELENIYVSLEKAGEILTINNAKFDFWGEKTLINGQVRNFDDNTQVAIDLSMPEFNIGEFFKRADSKDIIAGTLIVHGNLELEGGSLPDMLRTAEGELRISGSNLTLKGVDLDVVFSEFNNMKKYKAKDFVLLLTIGPLTTMLGHGYDQLSSIEEMMQAKGSSTVSAIISKWGLKNGLITAEDVAFLTENHIVAVKGSVNLTDDGMLDMSIATIDANGCVINSEGLKGTLKEPEIKDIGVFRRTLIEPLKRAMKTDCRHFYDGTLAPRVKSQPESDENNNRYDPLDEHDE